MKKITKYIFIIFSLPTFTGCVYKNYSGEHPAFYTEAINSVLWNNGHSFSADRYSNSEIKVLEKDNYGRIMYTYFEKYYSGGVFSFTSLIICQYFDNDYVYYYEDINFISKEQVKHSHSNINFNASEIEALKSKNDWGQKLKKEQCTKKVIDTHKNPIPYFQQTADMVKEEFGDSRLTMHYLTSDCLNNYLIYGYVMDSEGATEYFVGYVELFGNSVSNVLFFKPTSLFDYQDELAVFKSKSGWVYD